MSQTDLPRLSAPAHRALDSVGITKLEDFAKFTETEIAKLHGMGPNALGKIRAALESSSLAFKS